MITTRNENVVAAARAAAHPTSERDIERFARTIPLADIAVACPVTLELYGVKSFGLNQMALAQAWVKRGLGRGFDDAAYLAQQRIAALAG